MDDDSADERAEVVTVEIWPCHIAVVEAFRLCTIAAVGAGMGGLYWIGIEAVEMRSALTLCRVPRAQWPEFSDDLRFMGSEVANERNKRQSAESRGKRRG